MNVITVAVTVADVLATNGYDLAVDAEGDIIEQDGHFVRTGPEGLFLTAVAVDAIQGGTFGEVTNENLESIAVQVFMSAGPWWAPSATDVG